MLFSDFGPKKNRCAGYTRDPAKKRLYSSRIREMPRDLVREEKVDETSLSHSILSHFIQKYYMSYNAIIVY